jgi:uncharacterized protein (TIGR00251 family)
MTTFKDARSGAAITVKVTPKAKRTGVVGLMDDGTLKIQVTAPAEEGKANAALVAFLAEALGVKASQVEIVAGLSSERKLVSLIGVSPADVDAKLVPAKREAGLKKAGKRANKK